jgi:hypothetical protein
MATLDGFYVVKKDDKFYKARGVFVDKIDDAYAFMLPHCATNLAERIGGEMVRK